jgi:hypothetical protein
LANTSKKAKKVRKTKFAKKSQFFPKTFGGKKLLDKNGLKNTLCQGTNYGSKSLCAKNQQRQSNDIHKLYCQYWGPSWPLHWIKFYFIS